MLEAIAEKRGCLLKGKGLDYSKAAGILIEDFRSGRLGRLYSGTSVRKRSVSITKMVGEYE